MRLAQDDVQRRNLALKMLKLWVVLVQITQVLPVFANFFFIYLFIYSLSEFNDASNS